jgi:uncharacterized membrane protein
MARLVFFGGVVALIVLILIWDRTTIGAKGLANRPAPDRS